ncbi:MAG: hypothetical protein ACFCAD_15380 [Pleurocapsa sp.]
MKLILWTIGLSLTSSLLPSSLFFSPAVAQCVQADVSVQYNISGSRDLTERTNDVEMSSDGACRGNASVTSGVQGNIGGNCRVRQNRVVRHRLKNSRDNRGYPGGSTIQIQSNPAIDVYNPADNLDY